MVYANLQRTDTLKEALLKIGTDAHEPKRIADFQMEYVSDFMERFKLKVEPAMKI